MRTFNYGAALPSPLASLKGAGRALLFVAAGLIAVIVGSFMLRGNMHMWDGAGGGGSARRPGRTT